MKVLLLKDQRKLGKKGDIVNVSDGYATSALIPSGTARPATPDVIAASKRKEQASIDTQKSLAQDARNIAQNLKGKIVHVSVKADGEKIFGSVGSADIADAIKKEYNISIDSSAPKASHIKETGTHNVVIDLGSNVTTTIVLDVSGH